MPTYSHTITNYTLRFRIHIYCWSNDTQPSVMYMECRIHNKSYINYMIVLISGTKDAHNKMHGAFIKDTHFTLSDKNRIVFTCTLTLDSLITSWVWFDFALPPSLLTTQ